MLNYHLTLFDVKKNTIIFKIEILLYFSNLHKFILYLLYIYICYNWTIINTIKSFIYLCLIKSVRQSDTYYEWGTTGSFSSYVSRRLKRNQRTEAAGIVHVDVAEDAIAAAHVPNDSEAIEVVRRQRPPISICSIFL